MLRHTIRYELTRPPGHPAWRLPLPREGRLLREPVFVFSAARSGSTLLRAILGSHSQLYAPPELPLKHLAVTADTAWIRTGLTALRLTSDDLQELLWDRVLADALQRSGKPTIVVKTPSNVLVWRQIAHCWPDARYIFLLRHPAAAVASLHASWKPEWHPGESGSLAEAVAKGARYMTAVQEARGELPGITVRYEDITADPGTVIRDICHDLGVAYEPGMLDYGRFADNRFTSGLGDASIKIRSGAIAPPDPPPREVPAELRWICAAWGYLDESQPRGPVRRDAADPPADRSPRSGSRQSANASGGGQAHTR